MTDVKETIPKMQVVETRQQIKKYFDDFMDSVIAENKDATYYYEVPTPHYYLDIEYYMRHPDKISTYNIFNKVFSALTTCGYDAIINGEELVVYLPARTEKQLRKEMKKMAKKKIIEVLGRNQEKSEELSPPSEH